MYAPWFTIFDHWAASSEGPKSPFMPNYSLTCSQSAATGFNFRM